MSAAKRWYIGSMNDALFIIDTPPRPSTDDVWHDRPDGPTMSLSTWPLEPEQVRLIVDAHNSELEESGLISKLQEEVKVKALPLCFKSHHKYVGKCPYCGTKLKSIQEMAEEDKMVDNSNITGMRDPDPARKKLTEQEVMRCIKDKVSMVYRNHASQHGPSYWFTYHHGYIHLDFDTYEFCLGEPSTSSYPPHPEDKRRK